MAKITVNESCIGCGACTAVGLAVVVSEENIDGAKEAAESCPVEAIEVE